MLRAVLETKSFQNHYVLLSQLLSLLNKMCVCVLGKSLALVYTWHSQLLTRDSLLFTPGTNMHQLL